MCEKLNFVYMIDRMKLQCFDFAFSPRPPAHFSRLASERRRRDGKTAIFPTAKRAERREKSTTTPSTNFSEIFHWHKRLCAARMWVEMMSRGSCLLAVLCFCHPPPPPPFPPITFLLLPPPSAQHSTGKSFSLDVPARSLSHGTFC